MVIWSKPARDDLRAIHSHIALDSRVYARKVVTDIVDRVDRVAGMPEIGRIVPEMHDTAIREIFVHSYRIIYQICEIELLVLAVVHGHRSFENTHLND